jgi:hypothetical protein
MINYHEENLNRQFTYAEVVEMMFNALQNITTIETTTNI